MGFDAWFTVAMLGLVFGLLAFTNVAPDVIFLAALTLLITVGILTPEEALEGAANPGVLTVAVLYVVACGLQETGLMANLAARLLGHSTSIPIAQLRMMLPVAAMSAFINNTPIVVMWLPVLDDWAKKHRVSPSKLMMPLSYAAILGGVCTLIGTSTNLVVNGLLVEQAHLEKPLKLFDISWVGIPCAVVGITYIVLASRWLLPDRRTPDQDLKDAKEYTVEMLVEPGSPLIGKTIEEAGLRHLRAMFLMEVQRGGDILPAVSPETRLRADDRLVFVGIVESVVELQRFRGLTPATNQVFKLDAPRERRTLIEAVVSNTCPLVGKTVREGRFRTIYNAVIIAVSRNGERVRKKIGDIVIEAGDTLLVEAHPQFIDQQRNSRDFYLVSRIEGYTAPRHKKANIAGLIFVGMIVVAAFEVISLLHAAMIASGLMIITRCCSSVIARNSIRWEVLIAIAASFGIGEAMFKTGLADHIAQSMLGFASGNAWAALAIIYLLTMFCTELMTNNAAAVLLFPIGMATATSLGASIMPFAIAVMVAASFGFSTPLGYQTNLMVYGPGGYKLSDFLWMGIPLNFLMAVMAVLLIPIFWPFHP